MLEQLIDFLRLEFEISAGAISLAQKTEKLEAHTLPIILWQYGLLNSKQLDQVFDWLES
ncbi:MAG: DUF2949 domain-containing protein [Cyanobacteria bacterium J083]|nr:MAG: DUF2949 domain-containing protein [Cyanobacteria bacterium J083]